MEGETWLVASLLYGSGLRLMDGCRLRVLDIDFEMRQITVRNGKGAKDRVTMLPSSLVEPLKSHLQLVKLQHERDCEQGCGQVYLPLALDRKYRNAPAEWKWQYVFPANRLSTDPRSGDLRRHHIEEQKVQRAVPRQRRTPAYSRK
jgi:integrase